MLNAVKNLLIPRKNQDPVSQPDYQTDMRAIETWANAIVKNLGGGYASLTGPGQTTTPGALTQDGDFTINDNVVGGIFDAFVDVATISARTNVTIVGNSAAGGGTVSITAAGTGGLVTVSGKHTNVGLSPGTGITLSFFNFGSGSTQIAGAGITTVAQLVTALQAYGLLG